MNEKVKIIFSIVLCIIVVNFFLSCSESLPQPFDAQTWKSGDYATRANMVNDIRNRIKGKTEEEVKQLLGDPEFVIDSKTWAYKIINSPRCRIIWNCGMKVYFDKQTNRVIEVAISD